MANNKNKNPKKESKKGQGSKKSNLSRTSPAQKENRPKKTKTKPDPGDRIAMSQELIKHTQKKTNHNRSRTKQDSNRKLPNGKIMPTLADLEKMFEDSDDDTDSTEVPKTDNTNTSSPVIPNNMVIDIDTVFSPNTCAKITQQCKEILNNCSKPPGNDPTASKLQSPSRKRLNFDTCDKIEECDDLPLGITAKKMKYDISDTQLIENYENDLPMSPIPEPSKNDEGNLSETSVDSNKTIEYKITPSQLQSNVISQAFSPLPSTSKDDKTFTKNDELFFECSKEINNNKTKEMLPSSPKTEIPIETSDNEIIVQECQEEIKAEVDNDIEIVDIADQNNFSDTNPGDKQHDDDDDCIFVDCYTNTTNQVSKEPDIIDLEYDFIDSDAFNCHTYDNIDDEVIDVDALIAKNQSILNKYKTTDTNKSTNLVVDVDVSKIVENSMGGTNNIQKQDNKHNIPSSASEISNNTRNLQGQPNHDDEVIHISEFDAENTRYDHLSRNLSNNLPVSKSNIIDVESTTKHTRKQHTFTEQDVSKFFNGNYSSPKVGQWTSFLFDLVEQLQFGNNNSPAHQFPETSQASSTVSSHPTGLTSLQNQINIPRTSQRTSNIPAMFQNTPRVLTPYQRATSTYPIYRRTPPIPPDHPIYRRTSPIPPDHPIYRRTSPIPPDHPIYRRTSPIPPDHPIYRRTSPIPPDHPIYGRTSPIPPDYPTYGAMYSSRPPASPSRMDRLPLTLAPIFEQIQPPNPPPPPAQSTNQRKQRKTKKNNPLLPPVQTPSPPPDKSSRKLGECPICMDRLSERVIASTICGHVFCMSCLEQAIRTNKRCPTCRKIIKKNGYHQIFL